MVTKYLIPSILTSIIGDCEKPKKNFLENRKGQKIGKKQESKQPRFTLKSPIAENVGLKEINRNLKTENERLESDLEDSENAWGKFANAELEEMEDNSDEFFVVIDEMNDELIAENVGLKETNRNLKTDNEWLKSQ